MKITSLFHQQNDTSHPTYSAILDSSVIVGKITVSAACNAAFPEHFSVEIIIHVVIGWQEQTDRIRIHPPDIVLGAGRKRIGTSHESN
jgi:hypothetical protein